MEDQNFAQVYFLSKTGMKLLAKMDASALHPARLGDSVNAFSRDFHDNLRLALLEELEQNGKLGDTIYIQLEVDCFVYPLDYPVDFGKTVDIDGFLKKLNDEFREKLPFYFIYTSKFRLQGGESI